MFDEDLTVFFDPSEHAVEATLQKAVGGPLVPANVIYNAAGGAVGDFEVISLNPSVELPTADWPEVEEGDIVRVLGQQLLVRTITPLDDGALTRIDLVRG